jgi:hypothetical protein
MQPEREQAKRKNLFKINRVLDVIPRGSSGIAQCLGYREGRGPLPSTKSDIHPLRKMSAEVVEQIEKRQFSQLLTLYRWKHEPASPLCRD